MTTNNGAAELAYLGDAVFELMVREKLLSDGIAFRELNTHAQGFVSAPAQAAMYHKIFPMLAAEEQAVMKRGRNLHNFSRAKNARVAEYRHATGLETLFGWLHQQNETHRLTEIFQICIETEVTENEKTES